MAKINLTIEAFNENGKRIPKKNSYQQPREIKGVFDGFTLSQVNLWTRLNNSDEVYDFIEVLKEIRFGFLATENIRKTKVSDLQFSMNFISELRDQGVDLETIEKAIDEVKQNEAEQAEQSKLGDAWAGGFASNH